MKHRDKGDLGFKIGLGIIALMVLYELIKFGYCTTHPGDLRCLGYFSNNR